MTRRFAYTVVVSSLALCLTFPGMVLAQSPARVPSASIREGSMMSRANGTFEVKVTPQSADGYADGATMGRLTLDKQFRGDLEGTSKGQMLTAITSVKGSAGYVAVELVSGTIAGRGGSFILQHSGTMSRGTQALTLTVVPDSGTDGLTGLTGTMVIIIANGTHAYEFDYSLPRAP
ncbi:MAG: DUF3224 domain-containing protein [Gemmatimonadaceae bacterium]|nr:DUF3224 domain-containing protein [Gemmatimonadaceae bacterium]